MIGSETDRRQRRRPQLSCVLCRRRKVKCNRELPCDQCYKLSKGRSCVYNDIVQSLGNSDHGTRSDNASRSPLHRSPFESNTGLPRLRGESNLNILGEQSNGRQSRHRDTSAVSSISSLAGPGSSRPGLQEVAPTAHLFHQINPIFAHESEPGEAHIHNSTDQPNLNFIEDGWMTEFHGESHWSTILPKLGDVTPLIHNMTVSAADGRRASFWKYLADFREKGMMQLNAHIIDLGLVTHVDFREELASREVADKLVASYHASFGQVYGILPWRDFMTDYEGMWLGVGNYRCEFAVILTLIFAIGAAFVNEREGCPSRSTILKWFNMAKVWRNTIADIKKYNVTLLQVDILLFLTKRLHGIGPPIDSVGSAVLVRNAMAMSLHKDIPGLPVEERSLRRRLWYVVLELDVQSSFESGMEPTCPKGWQGLIPSRPREGQGLSQSTLIRSLPIRFKIAHLLNSPRLDLTHEEACELNDELLAVGRSEERTSANQSFVEEYTGLVIARAILALHWPFAVLDDPRYHFSRHLCFFTAFKMLQQLTLFLGRKGPQDAASRLSPLQTLIRGQCFIYQNDAFPAALFLCFELLRGLTKPDVGTLPGQIPSIKQDVTDLLKRFIILAEERVVCSDYSEIAFLIPSIIPAYVSWADRTGAGSVTGENEGMLQEMVNRVAQRCVSLMDLRPVERGT